MIKKGLFFCLLCALTACTLTPKPISVSQRYQTAQYDLNQLFAKQEGMHGKLSLAEALARGLKYNLDYRVKLVNTALQAGQLDVAMYTMFPNLNVSASLYNRNNVYATVGVTPEGTDADVLTPTPNTLRSARTGMTWNVLDFGLGYVRAKQQGNRLFIAEEESRKQLQRLSQDILVAYWTAYTAQQLLRDGREFQKILDKSTNILAVAMRDKLVPQENILNYQAALLEGKRHLIELQFRYDKSMLDLKRLLNFPLYIKLDLESPPFALLHTQNLSHLNFEKIDAITLAYRPELRGQDYQTQIAKLGTKAAILQALPGITLNEGWNYNSNKFLLNKDWVDRSVDLAWNLLNIVSLPTTLNTANAQVEFEKLKLMALTLTALTETRYAYSHYESLRQEYDIVHKQTENAQAIFQLNKNRQLASLASNQQVIIAKLRSLVAEMNENSLLSDLSTALGELYLSVGSDIIPSDIGNKSVGEITDKFQHYFTAQQAWDFSYFVDVTYEKMFKNRFPYTIQLFGDYDLVSVKKEQSQLHLSEPTYIAKTVRNRRDWYILTTGKYLTFSEAKLGMEKLMHTPYQTLLPWVRNTNELTWIS